MENEVEMENNLEIKEIALNPRFLVEEVYESLKNQGFSVRWMTEEEINEGKFEKVIYY